MNYSILVFLISSAAAFAKPNVLFIAVDDLRPQLGCYGDAVVKSPNIDQLAAHGMVFVRAYCQQALCAPSRVSLLSGRRPATTRIYEINEKLTLRSTMPDITSLPQHFKNQGYITRGMGKIYHGGIDDPISWSVPSWKSKKPRFGPIGLANADKRRLAKKSRDKDASLQGEDRVSTASPAFESVDCTDNSLRDGDMAREAVTALRDYAKNPEQPFFLAVGFSNPHVPWVAPKKYFDLYDPAKLTLPANNFVPRNAPPFAATSGEDFYWYAGVPSAKPLPEEYARQCLHGYLAAISYIDAQIGRLLAALEENEQARNTVIVLCGDHGYYMGEHGWWGGKHNNYNGATRAPLIISVPGQKSAGRKSSALVEFVDIFPSLTEICGLPAPKDASGLEGASFAPLLENPDKPWKTAAFSQYPRGGKMGTAMQTERYRYVEWQDGKAVVARELYDHRTDPAENENIINSADPALLQSLAEQMKSGWKGALPR